MGEDGEIGWEKRKLEEKLKNHKKSKKEEEIF